MLRAGLNTLDTVKDILPFFRAKHYNSDYTLTDKQCADVLAYDALLKEKLYPALQFIWYEIYRNMCINVPRIICNLPDSHEIKVREECIL